MKPISGLFYCPMGEWVLEKPREGESLERAHKRLKRLARKYAQWGRSFRVELRGDAILWWRVQDRKNTKLALWYALPVGESVTIERGADGARLKAAKATARYLRSKGEGTFVVSLEGEELRIRRTEGAAGTV